MIIIIKCPRGRHSERSAIGPPHAVTIEFIEATEIWSLHVYARRVGRLRRRQLAVAIGEIECTHVAFFQRGPKRGETRGKVRVAEDRSGSPDRQSSETLILLFMHVHSNSGLAS
jgi:hypothetical protein